jgi:two-component system, NtrC family, sensor kinase
MGKINGLLFVAILFFHSICFSQSRIIDSLKTELQNAKDDTTRLNIYLKLGEVCEKKDKLLYARPALNLADKILSGNLDKQARDEMLDKEDRAYNFIFAYSNATNSSIERDKVMGYMEARLRNIEKTGNKKRVAEILNQISGLYLFRGDTTSARENIQKSLQLFIEIKDTANIVDEYRYLSYYYSTAGNLLKAFEFLQLALNTSSELNYKKGMAMSLAQLADMYRDNGEDTQAMENYNAALSILNETKDTADLFNVIAAIGGFYNARHMSDKALEFYNKLFSLTGTDEHKNHKISSIYKWIGIVYKDNNDNNNALLNLQKSLVLSDSLNAEFQGKGVLDEIGSVYQNQGLLEKAIDYHSRAVRLADSLQFTTGKAASQYLLAGDYFLKRDYKTAKQFNNDALSFFSTTKLDLKLQGESELLGSRIDSAIGDINGAYTHYKNYVSLTNKLQGEAIRKEAQKESFHNELNKKEIEQQKKDIEAKRVKDQQYLAIAALGIIVLAVLLIVRIQYKNNKHRQQANIALRQEKEKVEAALTELKSTQSQLIQSEKMASLGELTAGIAHEIQNPLNFVNNFSDVNTELIEELKSEKSKVKSERDEELENELLNDIAENEKKINHHGKRADAIVKGMLQHSRSSSSVKEPTNIKALADEYLRLAYHGLKAKEKEFNATMKTDFDETVGNINIIPQDIGRVLLNLYNNAFYAVNEKKKQQGASYEPTITVSTKKINDKVEISVSDNGNGIPQKIVDKIFQPFFTTKPTGQGTGLGLSLSYDIIKAHGGEIKVETKEGEGVEFMIQLPV